MGQDIRSHPRKIRKLLQANSRYGPSSWADDKKPKHMYVVVLDEH